MIKYKSEYKKSLNDAISHHKTNLKYKYFTKIKEFKINNIKMKGDLVRKQLIFNKFINKCRLLKVSSAQFKK